jgi:hypothetical protein
MHPELIVPAPAYVTAVLNNVMMHAAVEALTAGARG